MGIKATIITITTMIVSTFVGLALWVSFQARSSDQAVVSHTEQSQVSPELQSSGELESEQVASASPTAAGDEFQGDSVVGVPDDVGEPRLQSGPTWSLADVQRTWGEEQGWEWDEAKPGVSGDLGVVQYDAKHTDGRTGGIQVAGTLDNLTFYNFISTIGPAENALDPEKLKDWSFYATAMASQVTGADSSDVAAWFRSVFRRFFGRIVDHEENMHTEKLAWQGGGLSVMFVQVTTSYLSAVMLSCPGGVSDPDTWLPTQADIGNPSANIPDYPLDSFYRSGLGWSLTDVQRKWSKKQGWNWYYKEPALSGEPGVIDCRAKYAYGNNEEMQVVGIPEDLRAFSVRSSLQPHVDAFDNAKVAAWSSNISSIAAEVAGADPKQVTEWFITEFSRFIARLADRASAAQTSPTGVVDGQSLSHDATRRWGIHELHVVFILTTEGYFGGIIVSGTESWSQQTQDYVRGILGDPSDWRMSSSDANAAFVYGNVSSRRPEYGGFRVIGEITNNSGRTYQMATFTLSIYDSNRRLVDTAPILMMNFAAGATKSFDAYVETLPSGWDFKIDFESGF